jgi:hypothetical protein
MSTFNIVSPIPNLRESGKQELKAYFQWFLSIIPERLDILPRLVNDTPGFESWAADFSPESLSRLGEWFAGRVGTRMRSAREIADIAALSPYPVEVPAEELSDGTFGLAHDVGIYLAEMLRHQHPPLAWIQILGNKQKVEYGHVGLAGFRGVDFSPVHIAITLAYGIAAKNRNARSLRCVYDVWARMIVK